MQNIGKHIIIDIIYNVQNLQKESKVYTQVFFGYLKTGFKKPFFVMEYFAALCTLSQSGRYTGITVFISFLGLSCKSYPCCEMIKCIKM